jgi:hypothetical protein
MLKKILPDSGNAYYAGFDPPSPDTLGQTPLPGPINHPPSCSPLPRGQVYPCEGRGQKAGGPQFCVFSPSTLLRAVRTFG